MLAQFLQGFQGLHVSINDVGRDSHHLKLACSKSETPSRAARREGVVPPKEGGKRRTAQGNVISVLYGAMHGGFASSRQGGIAPGDTAKGRADRHAHTGGVALPSTLPAIISPATNRFWLG